MDQRIRTAWSHCCLGDLQRGILDPLCTKEVKPLLHAVMRSCTEHVEDEALMFRAGIAILQLNKHLTSEERRSARKMFKRLIKEHCDFEVVCECDTLCRCGDVTEEVERQRTSLETLIQYLR